MMNILTVTNLCKTYGQGESQVQALKNVSFTLSKGEFAAVVGESGSGKSTLLNCIGGLDVPASGSVCLDGQDLFAMNDKKRTVFRRQKIGFVFQSFHLVSELTVEQNIIFPLLLIIRSRTRRQWMRFWRFWGLQNGVSIFPVSCPAGSSREWQSEGR